MIFAYAYYKAGAPKQKPQYCIAEILKKQKSEQNALGFI